MKEQKQDAIVQALDERLAIARTYQFKTLIENLAAARAQLAAEREAARLARVDLALIAELTQHDAETWRKNVQKIARARLQV